MGCTEHYTVHKLRKSKQFVRELDFVAIYNDVIIENIVYAETQIINNHGHEHIILTFEPVSVLPQHQNKELVANSSLTILFY